MLDKYQAHAGHNLGTYLQYADHIKCIGRATLLVVNDGGKEKRKEEKNGGS